MTSFSLYRYLITLCICLSLMPLGGCTLTVSPNFSRTALAEDMLGDAGYEVTDYRGNTIRLDHKPQRILSLSMSLDIILLGLVSPDRLAAVDKSIDDPGISPAVEAARSIEHKYYDYTLETVAMLKPDLIIAPSFASRLHLQTYRDLGFKVFICRTPRTVEEIKKNILSVARAVGEPAAGYRIIDNMDLELNTIKDRLANLNAPPPQPKGFLISTMATYGGIGCIFDSFCREAQVTNAIAAMGVRQGELITKELMIRANPDFFLLSAPHSSISKNSLRVQQEFLNDPALQNLQAIKNNRVLFVPDRYLYASHQNCVYAIKGLANFAYGGHLFDMSTEHLITGH